MSKYILFSSLYAGVIGTGNEPPRSQTAAVVGAFGLSDRPRTRTDQPYRLAAAGEPDRPHRFVSERPERASSARAGRDADPSALRSEAGCAPPARGSCAGSGQLGASALRQNPPARGRRVTVDVDCVTVSASLRCGAQQLPSLNRRRCEPPCAQTRVLWWVVSAASVPKRACFSVQDGGHRKMSSRTNPRRTKMVGSSFAPSLGLKLELDE